MWSGPFHSNKMLMVVLFCVMLVPLAGCDSTSAQRIESLKFLVDNSLRQSAQLDASIDKLEAVIQEQKKALADPNTPDGRMADIVAFLEKASATLGTAQAKKQVLEEQMTKWQAQIEAIQASGEVGIGDELDLYGQGIAEGGKILPPPYSTFAILLGTLLSAAGGMYGTAKRKQAQQAQSEAAAKDTVAQDIIKSVEVLLTQMDAQPLSAAQAKTVLRAEQDRQTRQVVRSVTGEQT